MRVNRISTLPEKAEAQIDDPGLARRPVGRVNGFRDVASPRNRHPHERISFAMNESGRILSGAAAPDIFSLKHESSIFRPVIQSCMWFLYDVTG